MNNKIRPALIAGAAIGLLLVLTTIVSGLPVPFLNFLGCCRCLWPVAGGLLATLLYVRGSTSPATILDGVIVGALAGVIGALIHAIIGLPISYFMVGVEAMEMQARRFSSDFPLSGVVLFVITGIVGFVIFTALSTIGGLIGVPIFEKRKESENLPPRPPDVGGGPAGTYGTGL